MFRMPPPADPARRIGRAGFSLLELLVALVIGGILSAAVLRFLQGHTNFAQRQNDRQEVQQGARGAVELISAELRSVPPGAIRVAERNRIQFLLPRAWGVLCQPITTAGAGSVWILFPAGTFPTDVPGSIGTATDWGMAVPALNEAWSNSGLTAITSGTPSCNATYQASAAGWEARRFSYSSLPSGAALGAAAFIYQQVTYEIGPDPATGDSTIVWLRRNIGTGNPEPIVGPLGPEGSATTQGLVFDYQCRNGRMTSAPGNGGSTGFPLLTGVKIAVQVESANGTGIHRELQHDSTVVHLRNARGEANCTI